MKILILFLLVFSLAGATTPKVEVAVFATIDLERAAASGLKLEQPGNLPDFKLTYLRGPGPTDVIGIYEGGFPTLFNTQGQRLEEIKGTIADQAITWICWSEEKDGKKLFGSETVISSSRMVVEFPEAKTESVVLFHIFIMRQDSKALAAARNLASDLIKKGPNKALVPTVMSVTPAADAPVAPATTAAHL